MAKQRTKSKPRARGRRQSGNMTNNIRITIGGGSMPGGSIASGYSGTKAASVPSTSVVAPAVPQYGSLLLRQSQMEDQLTRRFSLLNDQYGGGAYNNMARLPPAQRNTTPRQMPSQSSFTPQQNLWQSANYTGLSLENLYPDMDASVVPPPLLEREVTDQPGEYTVIEKPARGRPKGSKNKPKGLMDMFKRGKKKDDAAGDDDVDEIIV